MLIFTKIRAKGLRGKESILSARFLSEKQTNG